MSSIPVATRPGSVRTGTRAQRLALSLGTSASGALFYEQDTGLTYMWDGSAWEGEADASRGVINPLADPYNCKADRVDLVDGAVTLAAPTVFTSASAVFTSADVGKAIAVEAAGVGGSQSARTTSGASTLTLNFLTLTINNATGGTWTYTHSGLGTVSSIAAAVTAGTLQTSLEALYGSGKVSVSLSSTTYTITLLSGAASQDTSLVTTSAAGLTGTTNAAAPTITNTNQSWSYGDVGKRVHIPGAGAAGGVLVAVIGSIEPVNSNIAYLTDTSGTAVTASATGTFTFYTLNWLRTTIASVTNATTIVLTTTLDSGVKANLSSLAAYYGTDNKTGLQAALDAAVLASKPLDLGSGNYLTTGGISNFTANGRYVIYGRAASVVAIPTDTEADSGALRIGASASETSSTIRARRVSLSDFTWSVPTAHFRGLAARPLPVGITAAKTNPGCIFIGSANNVTLNRVRVDTCYGVGFYFQNCRYGIVSHCEAVNTWADSFNLNNTNSVWNGAAYGDFTFIGCYAANPGDDMFAVNHRYAYSGGRPRNLSYIGCRGSGMRNHALGRGINIEGGTDVTISGCEVYQTNGAGLNLNGGVPTNASILAVITTPSTGAQVDFASAPANVAAGTAGTSTTTQMQIFNGTTGQTWIGDVTAVTNSGKTLTLAARSDQAATCPFTGTNYAQWGATSDGARFGVGGVNRCTITGFTTDTSVLDTAGDAVVQSAVSIKAGPSTTLEISDVRIRGLIVKNAYQCGIMFRDALVTTSDVPSARSQLVRDIDIEGYIVDGVGFSTLTAARPWAGVYVQVGQNITLRNGVIKDTDDNAVLIANTNVAGRISIVDAEARDIGRTYTTGSPLTSAFDPGTNTGYTGRFERLLLTNPAGTASGTQYVSTNVLGEVPTGSIVFGVNSDITGQNLRVTSASRYRVIVSPVMYEGKGTPEGTVTAPVGALYQRSDGASGTTLYVKESGTGNTGWIAYGAPSGQAAPELDEIYWINPIGAITAAAVVVANQVYYMRLKGNGTATNVLVYMSTTAGQFGNGNVLAAIYANNGSTGRNARPTGNPLGSSTSQATVSGLNTIQLGSTQPVTHLNEWVGIVFANASDRIENVAGAVGSERNGYAMSQAAGSFTLPTVASLASVNTTPFGAIT